MLDFTELVLLVVTTTKQKFFTLTTYSNRRAMSFAQCIELKLIFIQIETMFESRKEFNLQRHEQQTDKIIIID